MGFFDKHLKSEENKSLTTKDFYIGSSEAEAEVSNARITLDEVFDDYLGIMKEINHEKFIVTGRKGTGKSAIGAHIQYRASQDANLFSAFIRKNDVDIEKIVQISKDANFIIQNQLLFKWIILTKILSLIAENENIKSTKEYTHLSKFIERNRGFIDIKNNEIVETIKESGISIQTEYFKRLFSAVLNKEIKIKESKAEFYKLIPNLQEVILKLLEQDQDNKYVLIFDDLDIGFSSKSATNIETLTELIRIAKEFNNEIFGAKGGNVKIILLLRDDIVKYLIHNADTAKIFASYEVTIKWYEDIYRYNESNIKLKQFIEDRLKRNFERLNIDVKNGIWETFVDESEFLGTSKTCFKYIIDHTFYRPRDIILLFKNISSAEYPLPLSKNNINQLIGIYSNEVLKELYNELSVSFSKDEVDKIFGAMEELSSTYKPIFSYEELYDSLKNKGLENPDQIIEIIYDYSLIGNQDNNENVNFKYREKGLQISKLDKSQSLIPHYILKVYFKQN